MYNSYYGLTFNPFDKQQLKEKDHFYFQRLYRNDKPTGLSQGHPGHRCIYRQTRHGQVLRPALFCLLTQSKPLPHGVPVSVHHQCCRLLQTALLYPGCSGQGRQDYHVPCNPGNRSHTFIRKSISPCFWPSMRHST